MNAHTPKHIFKVTAACATLPAFLCASYMTIVSMDDIKALALLAQFAWVFALVAFLTFLFLLPLFAVKNNFYDWLRKVVAK
ncbi:MAG: hypothetical protein K0R10_1537 [Alphaproteobacteria bacterium]|jgi:hypothetical protein|nr:hypothetical protein [Alphaproteobacteria bacterium]